MKIAVLAVTKRGATVAEQVSSVLLDLPGSKVDLWIPAKFSPAYPHALPYDTPLGVLCGRLFGEYRALVMVMALGIVVRLLAPFIEDKRKDPAVVVVDEKGRFAISTLSGHLGGANDLARYLQANMGCKAVITTATDTHDLPAVDLLVRDYHLYAEPFQMLKAVNAAIVNGDEVNIYSDVQLKGDLPAKFMIKTMEKYSPPKRPGAIDVLITNRILGENRENLILLRPRNLAVGLGCRRGVESSEIKRAITEALATAGKSIHSVKFLATADIRANEEGVIKAAEEIGLQLKFFSLADLARILSLRKNEMNCSDYVFNKIGVGGVCEPAALLAAQTAKLIFPKKAFNGITVAIAEGSSQLSEPVRANRSS